MVCPECRDGDHDHCEDTKHPHRLYRGCACQHAATGEGEAGAAPDGHDKAPGEGRNVDDA